MTAGSGWQAVCGDGNRRGRIGIVPRLYARGNVPGYSERGSRGPANCKKLLLDRVEHMFYILSMSLSIFSVSDARRWSLTLHRGFNLQTSLVVNELAY